MFNCARCGRQVFICQDCDRGHRHCGTRCAVKARVASQRRSQRLYQTSRKGRTANALRQQRYRQRKREKVTHQGSAPNKPDDLLVHEPSPRQTDRTVVVFSKDMAICCHFCQSECSPFVRNHFLQLTSRR